MAKAFFTQCACVLLKEPVSHAELGRSLSQFDVKRAEDVSESWALSGPWFTLSFRPDVNGYVAVDVVNQPWPDAMGDPKKAPDVFSAWAMGHFGPHTFPGGLERAMQQSWAWEPGREIGKQHTGFIRIRCSYAFGAPDDAPVFPADYDATAELRFVTDVAVAVLAIPQALCYFNPNGEVLRNRGGLQNSLRDADERQVLPLDLWSNVRLFKLEKGWFAMDTVGNAQLDLPDIEACFSHGYDFTAIDSFLRNVTWYLYENTGDVEEDDPIPKKVPSPLFSYRTNGELIKNGDTMDGPGDIPWKAARPKEGLNAPPRQVLRWFPLDDVTVPKALLKG